MNIVVPDGRAPGPQLERRCRVRIDWPQVNGVRIDTITRESFVGALSMFLACGHSHVVHFCAAHPTVEARTDTSYREILNKGALNVADGMPVAWAARMFGSETERLAGTDAMNLASAWGLDRGLRHYLYGGTPETLQLLQHRLEETYPGILIVGVESPPFRRFDGQTFAGYPAFERILVERQKCDARAVVSGHQRLGGFLAANVTKTRRTDFLPFHDN